jgi:hypothetical protein
MRLPLGLTGVPMRSTRRAQSQARIIVGILWCGVACLLLSLVASARRRSDVGSPCSSSVDTFRRIVADFQSRQQNTAIVVGIRHRGTTVFREATGGRR